ncbi:hypothetical protein Tco_0768464 [Tanacetum coccineum]
MSIIEYNTYHTKNNTSNNFSIVKLYNESSLQANSAGQLIETADLLGNKIVRVLPPLTLLRISAYSFYIPVDIHLSRRLCLQVIFDFLDNVFDLNTSDVALRGFALRESFHCQLMLCTQLGLHHL